MTILYSGEIVGTFSQSDNKHAVCVCLLGASLTQQNSLKKKG